MIDGLAMTQVLLLSLLLMLLLLRPFDFSGTALSPEN